MNIINKILYHWHFSKLNIIKTFIVNFNTLPFKTAIKLPIFIYGKLDIYNLMGTIDFVNCKISRGMIRMGANKEFLSNNKGASLIILSENSKITFEGACEISSNFLIRTGVNAHLHFGSNVFIGANNKIVCIKNISIGEGTRIGFESQLIDSDFHYTYNIEKNMVNIREKEIKIGKYNWIGNRTSISKGCQTSDYTIVGSSSIINKNYTNQDKAYPLLIGSPAKIVDNNIRRIFSLEIEEKLLHHFSIENSDKNLPLHLIEEIENNFI